jgi:hypothetical protein
MKGQAKYQERSDTLNITELHKHTKRKYRAVQRREFPITDVRKRVKNGFMKTLAGIVEPLGPNS